MPPVTLPPATIPVLTGDTMNALGLNALGYQDIRPLPDTRPSAERAADLLKKSVTGNVNHREDRELEALQGIGFALLAIAERLDADAQRPQPEPVQPRRRRFRRETP